MLSILGPGRANGAGASREHLEALHAAWRCLSCWLRRCVQNGCAAALLTIGIATIAKSCPLAVVVVAMGWVGPGRSRTTRTLGLEWLPPCVSLQSPPFSTWWASWCKPCWEVTVPYLPAALLQEEFPAFLNRVLTLKAEYTAMRMHERVAYLVFVIHTFQVRTPGCSPLAGWW